MYTAASVTYIDTDLDKLGIDQQVCHSPMLDWLYL